MSEVVIIGGGLAGLSCALSLEAAGVPVTLLEATDRPGGRVSTDSVEGFRLDRGFQVLLTAYPEAARLLDYDALQLRNFEPGALVWHSGKFHRFADPVRNPGGAAQFLFDSIVPLADKLNVAKLRARVQAGTWEEMFARPEKTTRDYLHAVPFTANIIERFFEPFFGGVFWSENSSPPAASSNFSSACSPQATRPFRRKACNRYRCNWRRSSLRAH